MNTPNKITLSRLLLIPIIVFFYLADFIPYGRLVAAIIFVIACLTDFVDGHIARKYNQVTDLGKFFDAIADKVLIMTGLILIIAAPINDLAPVVYPSYLGIICIIIILAREFIVSALRQIAAAKGTVLAADMGGKIKATLQDIAVTLYMFYAFFLTDIYPMIKNAEVAKNVTGSINFILMILLVAATILTIYSGASYLIKNRHVFKTKKVEESEETEEIEEVEETIEEESKKVVLSDEQKQAMDIFYSENKVTASALQKAGISTAKSSKIISELEELKLISPMEGRKRVLLLSKEEYDKLV